VDRQFEDTNDEEWNLFEFMNIF